MSETKKFSITVPLRAQTAQIFAESFASAVTGLEKQNPDWLLLWAFAEIEVFQDSFVTFSEIVEERYLAVTVPAAKGGRVKAFIPEGDSHGNR